MDFWKTLVVLVRRWYVALPALVVSLGLAAIAYESVPAKYEATGSIVLLSPSRGASTKSDTGQTNPLLAFDGSLTTVSTAITQVLLSPAVSEDLYRNGATASYEVGNGNLDGPFINVVADGKSPAEAQRTVRLVLQRARAELLNRQAAYNAPRSTYIQVDDLVQPTEAKELVGGKVRAAGAALALGLAASISTAFMIESISENRRERRRRAQQPQQPVPAFPGGFQDRYADRYAARYPGRVPDRVPDRVLDRIPERAGDRAADRGPGRNPERHNGRYPHRHPERVADRPVERAPERAAERAPDRLPSGLDERNAKPTDELSALLARRARGRAQG